MADAPVVTIDLSSPTPAFRQIAHALRRYLVEGRLTPGDTLPPIRQLAIDLGVHFNTVALAYRMLADEGWLDLRRRRGALVIERGKLKTVDRGRIDHLLKRVSEIAAELRSLGLTEREIAAALHRIAERARP